MSSDFKDILIATIPSVLPGILVGIGIILTKNDINRVDGRINRIEDRLDRLDGKIEALSKRLSDAITMLVGAGHELDNGSVA